MIFILIASVYTTFLCWSWGFIFIIMLRAISNEQLGARMGFITTCFSGLALIGVVFSVISLFLPLGGLPAHAFLVIPPIILWMLLKSKYFSFIKRCITIIKSLSSVIIILLIVCIIMTLLLGATSIKHPDTLNYHAQCIQWIENYKVVPGLANLSYHYGLQSSWFILCALFSFKFTGITSLTFINCTVILWLIFFVGFKINECLLNRNYKNLHGLAGFMWLILLITSFWSYTQVRLTVTSASPDFVAVLYVWLIFFLVLSSGRSKPSNSDSLLLVFLSLFATLIKLSALPIIFLALYHYRYSIINKRAAILHLIICAMIVLTPAIIRNFITTGYPLFPLPYADFFHAEWQIQKKILFTQLDYITTYARIENINVKGHIANESVNFTQWIPIWWHNRSVPDKVILAGLVISFACNLLIFKKIQWRKYGHYLPVFFFSFVGVLFWFIFAPDPRFGFGFIIALEGVLIYFLISYVTKKAELNVNLLKGFVLLFAAIIMLYSVYRVTNFFKVQNLFTPAGVVEIPYKTILCHEKKINIPLNDQGCGNITLPCAYKKCTEFLLRGDKISDGFKQGNRQIRK